MYPGNVYTLCNSGWFFHTSILLIVHLPRTINSKTEIQAKSNFCNYKKNPQVSLFNSDTEQTLKKTKATKVKLKKT